MTADDLRRQLNYSPDTGRFVWRTRTSNCIKVGALAGSQKTNGYWVVGFAGRMHFAHRLAWLYVYGVWPDGDVDHINGNPSDNRIANLRLASVRQNQWNRGLSKKNTSGRKGVYREKRSNRWCAAIRTAGGRKFLGRFNDFESACAAYSNAANHEHGEFARRP